MTESNAQIPYCCNQHSLTLSFFVSFLIFHGIGVLHSLLATESPYEPPWANAKPQRVIQHSNPDGETLVRAVASLRPGDQLVIASGTYRVDRLWDINVSGTAEAPIWILAEPGTRVVITRRDAQQNVVNVGRGNIVHHLCLRNLEITGGSHGLRLGQCNDVWIDQCHIHHTGAVCLSANSANTNHLFLTRNHIHHGGGHGEGMYLGANHGEYTMSESVIALNHIHDCRGDQGDGIEVKQGSWGNLIAENHIHDTQYPCITVYGTAGKPINTIERNLCRRSEDHAMQVQGEAIVKNNILINAHGSAFASTDHQGKTARLQVIHNTMINIGHAFSGGSWNDREGMVLANNILYSRDGNAIHFPNGRTGVVIAGNVVLGHGQKYGSALGNGLGDFIDASWDAVCFDVKPTATAPFDYAETRYFLETDSRGGKRSQPTSGAMAY